MPTIDVELGLTVAIGGPKSHEFIKPVITIRDVDVDGDIDAQLQSSIEAIIKVWDKESQVMELKLGEALGATTSETMAGALSEQLKMIAETLVKHHAELQEVLPQVTKMYAVLKEKGMLEE